YFHDQFDGTGFSVMAVDEAHCVSTWGDSFRPDYQRIRVAAERLRIKRCSAFTATVDRKIEVDICSRIPLRDNFLRVSENPHRENLHLWVRRTHREPRMRFFELLSVLNHRDYNGPAIVYYNSVEGVTRLFERVRTHAICSTHGYTPYL